MIILDKSINMPYEEWHNEIEQEGTAVLINKPKGWTSFDAVAKIRKLVQHKKIGHCGTLDPCATGLLIICIGRKATRKILSFQGLQKQYIATLKLGAVTKSFDTETEEENHCSIDHLDIDIIKKTINSFVGQIKQIPPMFSAKKVKGKRMYDLARKNREINLEPADVNIYNIEILDINLPFVKILIDCSKGTYIRALARDIGLSLGVGAYLTDLERTKIGDFLLENALSIDDFMLYKNNN